jgi:hypothetical protein
VAETDVGVAVGLRVLAAVVVGVAVLAAVVVGVTVLAADDVGLLVLDSVLWLLADALLLALALDDVLADEDASSLRPSPTPNSLRMAASISCCSAPVASMGTVCVLGYP